MGATGDYEGNPESFGILFCSAPGAGERLGNHFANQHLTGLAGMNVASELVRRGKRAIQQAEGARVPSASR
jgi:hypothetical protein